MLTPGVRETLVELLVITLPELPDRLETIDDRGADTLTTS